ncbi:Serine hydrolase-like protein 2 [Entophlyctis luteolus]|nr:Serine hydrolase-like protein 2 [Entophlyctis luteolus]
MDPAAVTRVSVFLPFMVGQQLDNANTYNQVAPRLISCAEAAGISATFISIDLPGHGKSEHFGLEGTYFPWDYALAVLDVSVSLKWPKFTLIGHSMGGHIALLFAGIYPEMLENLVIIESVGYVNRLGDVKDDASALRTFISRRRSFTTDKSQQERSTYSSAEEAAKCPLRKGNFRGRLTNVCISDTSSVGITKALKRFYEK